nr:hypothetical protein [Tanacetum cinerariifolium]
MVSFYILRHRELRNGLVFTLDIVSCAMVSFYILRHRELRNGLVFTLDIVSCAMVSFYILRHRELRNGLVFTLDIVSCAMVSFYILRHRELSNGLVYTLDIGVCSAWSAAKEGGGSVFYSQQPAAQGCVWLFDSAPMVSLFDVFSAKGALVGCETAQGTRARLDEQKNYKGVFGRARK